MSMTVPLLLSCKCIAGQAVTFGIISYRTKQEGGLRAYLEGWTAKAVDKTLNRRERKEEAPENAKQGLSFWFFATAFALFAVKLAQ